MLFDSLRLSSGDDSTTFLTGVSMGLFGGVKRVRRRGDAFAGDPLEGGADGVSTAARLRNTLFSNGETRRLLTDFGSFCLGIGVNVNAV